MNETPHQKRVKHIDSPGHAHELTFTCYRRFPILENDEFKRMLSTAIDNAVEKQGFSLVGFIYMPEHVHLIVFPLSATASISSLLYAIKRPHSFRVKKVMVEHADSWLGRLYIRERPGKRTFRFWKEGGGYDRNIVEPATLQTSIDYIHANPIRRGLCENLKDWRWSSWHFYEAEHQVEGLPTVHGLPH